VTSVLATLLLASLAGGIYSLARPAFLTQTTGDTTTYRVSPDSARRSAALLALAVATAITLLRRNVGPQLSWLAGVLLTIALACAVPVWHQFAIEVAVTPDAMTAPLRGGLLPGPPTTLNFADLTDLRFEGQNTGKRYQLCRTKNRQEIELDMGPLFTAAAEQLEANARAHDVHVWHSF
jgi:hypothetical protein